jgi:hypothetical protein
MPINAKEKFLDIQRKNLLERLESLLSKLDNPNMTQQQLDEIKAEVMECQEKIQSLGVKA